MTRTILRSVFALLLFAASAAAAPAFVAVLEPVEVFNAPDVAALGAGLQSMLASRLADPAYDVRTSAENAPQPPSWRVRVTITRLGSVYSVDGSAENLTERLAGERAYETVDSSDKVFGAIEKVAARLKARLASAAQAGPAPVAVPAPAPAPGLSVSVTAQPAPIGSYTPPPGYVLAPAAPQPAPGLLNRYKLAGKVEGEALALAVADVNGDGAAEIVLLVEKEIVALRRSGDTFVEDWRKETDLPFVPYTLDAVDADGDGRAEIFVAGAAGPVARTQPYVYGPGGLEARGKPLSAFLRVVNHPERGPLLVGYRSVGGVEVLAPGLRRYAWQNDIYEPVEELPMPGDNKVSLNLDWVPSLNQGTLLSLLDGSNRLRLYDREMKTVYAGEAALKGARKFLIGDWRDQQRGTEGDSFEVSGHTVTVADPASGLPVFCLYDNIDESAWLPRFSGGYKHGRVLALRWDGLALHQVDQSPEFTGFIAGLALLPPAAPQEPAALVGLLVQWEGIILKDYTTQIVIFGR